MLRERFEIGSHPRFPANPRTATEATITATILTIPCSAASVTSPAQFDRGRASIQPPRPEELNKNLIPRVDYVAYEVGVDGMWLSQSEAMGQHLGWLDGRDNTSKRGNLRFVNQFNKDFSERDLIDLRTPDGWTLLRSVFEERGYDIIPTAKAAAARGQLELIGGAANLKVLASSKVRELLWVLSRRRGEKRPYVAERKTLKFEHFRTSWGREAARRAPVARGEAGGVPRGGHQVPEVPALRMVRDRPRGRSVTLRRLPRGLPNTPRAREDRVALPHQ